jgi:hypothetical protein
VLGRACAAFAGAMILVALTGCTSGATGTLAQSVAQSLSAVQTARLTLEQERDGRLVSGVASTALQDMLREAQDAEAGVASASPATPSERTLRARELALLHAATGTVVTAADVLERVPGAPSPTAALHDIDAVLTRLQAESRRLGSGR